MTDVILELSQNPMARNLVARAKLPIPLPEKLERQEGASEPRPLQDKLVFVCGQGVLSGEIAGTLGRAGADPWLASAALSTAFAGPGEAYGRHARVVSPPDTEDRTLHAIVIDASAVARASDLKLLWQSHDWLGALAHHG